MNIWIKKGKLITPLHTKPLNRHLFIPPHSCHSPGVFEGLFLGHTQHIFMLCSLKKDMQIELDLFLSVYVTEVTVSLFWNLASAKPSIMPPPTATSSSNPLP